VFHPIFVIIVKPASGSKKINKIQCKR